MQNKIKIAVIGTGFGAAVHIPVFQSLENVEVIAVVSSRAERAEAVAKQYGTPNFFSNYEDAFKLELDAVSVALPPYISGRIIRSAQKQGLHILAEKPLAATCAEIKEILQNNNSKKVEMVDFQFPELEAFQKLKSIVKSREFGNVRSVNVEWLVYSYTEKHQLLNWKRNRNLGGGVLNLLGSHFFYYVEWLFGRITILKALVYPENPGFINNFPLAEHTVSIIAEIEHGYGITAHISNAAPYSHMHSIEVIFDKANVLLKNDTLDYMKGYVLNLTSEDGKQTIYFDDGVILEDGRSNAFLKLANRFINAIKNGSTSSEVHPNFLDAYRVQQLVEATKQSSCIEQHKIEKFNDKNISC